MHTNLRALQIWQEDSQQPEHTWKTENHHPTPSVARTQYQGASLCYSLSGQVCSPACSPPHKSVVSSLCSDCTALHGRPLAAVSPEGDSPVCGRRQEGKVPGVPSALDHLVLVLPHHHERELLGEVPLQVCHLDLHIVRARQ